MARSATVEPSALGLKRIGLLDGVPAAALETLARQCRWRRYGAGQRVVSREARDTDVYLIVSGAVRITAFSASGRQVTYGDMPAGQWFGDFAAIDGLSRSADVVALADSLLAAMGPGVFRALIHEHPAVCDRMLLRLVARVRELTERVFEVSTLGVQNRLHAELLRLAHRAGVAGNSARIDPVPKHAEIAATISTYREQVTRELSAMAKQGLVRRSGSALVIPDVARLETIVSAVNRAH
ncbi:MAG: Crp/Fnr family transcriptional regulator [Burkholderiales bacterium]|nr:Crp/Fnr family transcriptional regulator [Burkholderiales bacterium]